ncbi:MAG TPA: hypothetical protein PKM65_17020 [Spirochaetota bacterium]|nr:hypothetical protein [Spirochaetota bacterium]HNT12169.1 hypothetical protein [Spirochaetota bacterium]
MERTETRIGVINGILSALHLYSLAQAQGLVMATVMTLGAPASQESALRTLIGYAVLAHPVVALVSLVSTWILFWKGRYLLSLLCALLPVANAIVAGAAILLSVLLGRPIFG